MEEPKENGRQHPIGNRVDRNTLLGIWRTARKYWVMVLATTIVLTLCVTFYTLSQPKIYQATSTVQLDPNPPRPLGKSIETVVDMGNGSYWNNREYYETQYVVMQSNRVALAVVRELDLVHDGSFLRNLPPSAQIPPPKNVTPEDAAEVLLTRLKVEAVKESRLATVRFEDADPARAQRVLTTLVDTYVEQNLEDALTSTGSAADWLRGQLDKLKGDLETSEMALHQFKMSNNILSVAFDDQSNMLREEMKQINDALTTVRTKQQEVMARRDELKKVPSDDPSSLPATELLQSPLLQVLRQRYEESVRERDSLIASGKGKQHPEVLGAQQKVDDTRTALLSEVKNIQGALDRDLSVIGRQEGGLSGLFEKAKKQALDLNLMEIEYNRLQRSKENTEKLYQLVLERTKESDLTRMLRVNNIRVLDRALVPKVPVRPRVPVNIALGILGGLALGLAFAMSRDLLDRSVKTPDDVETELDVPFLGLLPEMEEGHQKTGPYRRRRRIKQPAANAKRELVVHEFPMSGIAEAARAIRTNLMFMAPDKPHRTLLITSAGPAEGKTTVACCIAIAMAQAGQKVALVDCDMRRPRLNRIFGRENTIGVTTALLDLSIATEEAFATDIPNLSIVPSGPVPPNPAELLHSESFRRLLKHLEDHYDRVIIDSPPVVAVTDATILSTLVDGVLLVVRAFKTSKELCRQAVRAIRDVGGNTVGSVLNAVDLGRQEYGSYHYYYYRSEGGYQPLPPDVPAGGGDRHSQAVQ